MALRLGPWPHWLEEPPGLEEVCEPAPSLSHPHILEVGRPLLPVRAWQDCRGEGWEKRAFPVLTDARLA